MIAQEMENITCIGKWAKGRVLAPPEMQRSFYKSFTSGHECAGLVLCYVANDSLTLFDSVPDISCINLKKTCWEGHYFIISAVVGHFHAKFQLVDYISFSLQIVFLIIINKNQSINKSTVHLYFTLSTLI